MTRLIDADALIENMDGATIAVPPKATAKELFKIMGEMLIECI